MKDLQALKNELKDVESKISSPSTPQGDVKTLQWRRSSLKREIEMQEEKNFEEESGLSVYGSDDYVGCTAGEYSFYFGYEVTECPVKAHKETDDCDENDCDKREWCLVINKGDEEIARWPESTFTYGRADDIERKLIIGMARFIKENVKV